MYRPLRNVWAFLHRTTALLLSVSHLVLITRNACHSPSRLDWIDQSLSAAEEHMAVLREAALASEPERVAPSTEGFLQEQSAIWEKPEAWSSSNKLFCITSSQPSSSITDRCIKQHSLLCSLVLPTSLTSQNYSSDSQLCCWFAVTLLHVE